MQAVLYYTPLHYSMVLVRRMHMNILGHELALHWSTTIQVCLRGQVATTVSNIEQMNPFANENSRPSRNDHHSFAGSKLIVHCLRHSGP